MDFLKIDGGYGEGGGQIIYGGKPPDNLNIREEMGTYVYNLDDMSILISLFLYYIISLFLY